MTKTFTRAGVSTVNGVVTYRFANDLNREKTLVRCGHTDIKMFELGEAMTKEDAVLFLNAMGIVAAAAPRKTATKPAVESEPTVNTAAIRAEMLEQAHTVAMDLLNTRYGGKDSYACGFAWVNVYPEHKGNTRAGKAERKVLEAIGFSKDYSGAYQYWNPSKWGGQNIDVKEAGARAAADVLRKYGFTAYSGSRLD
jgi:hypothetical protein